MTGATDYKLFHSDAIAGLKCVKAQSIDAVISDPPYAEVIRKYGRLTELEWHALMDRVVEQTKRVLKPNGSAMFILQPNFNRVGEMRLWVWEFLIRTAKNWNLVQDCYWWNHNALPLSGTKRKQGLMRSLVKYCLWFGPQTCYRDQEAVLWEAGKFSPRRLEKRARYRSPSGRSMCEATIFGAGVERGGTTPMNLFPLSNSVNKTTHGATTPLLLADWWVRYLTKPGDIVLDPFSGSGTMGVAALQSGRSYLGFEKEEEYHRIAEERLAKVKWKKPLEKPRGEEVER